MSTVSSPDSGVSLRSDQSMLPPPDFKGLTVSESPDSVSLRSDRSMLPPPDLRDGAPSEIPDSVSLRSDRSMLPPPDLRDGSPSERGDSAVSLRSDWSTVRPLNLGDNTLSKRDMIEAWLDQMEIPAGDLRDSAAESLEISSEDLDRMRLAKLLLDIGNELNSNLKLHHLREAANRRERNRAWLRVLLDFLSGQFTHV